MGAFPDGKQKERWSVPFGLLGVTGQVDGYPGSRLPGRRREYAGLVKGCCRSYNISMNCFAAWETGRFSLWTTTSWRNGSVSDKELLFVLWDTEIRHEGDSKADAGQVDQKVIAAELDLRDQIEMGLLEHGV